MTVYSWGAMVAIGFLCGILVSIWLAKREKMDYLYIVDLAFYVLVSAIVGGRVFYVIQFWKDYQGKFWQIFAVHEGGLVFFGGLIFSLATILVYTNLKKIDLWKLLDVITPGFALGYAIGRIGCFLNGCCYGCPTDLPWGVKFPAGSLAAYEFPGVALHPTQLYSVFAGLFMFAVLMYLWKYRVFDGEIFLIGMILYSVYRFLVEFLRVNPLYIFNLSGAQLISLFILALAFGTFILRIRKR